MDAGQTHPRRGHRFEITREVLLQKPGARAGWHGVNTTRCVQQLAECRITSVTCRVAAHAMST